MIRSGHISNIKTKDNIKYENLKTALQATLQHNLEIIFFSISDLERGVDGIDLIFSDIKS